MESAGTGRDRGHGEGEEGMNLNAVLRDIVERGWIVRLTVTSVATVATIYPDPDGDGAAIGQAHDATPLAALTAAYDAACKERS